MKLKIIKGQMTTIETEMYQSKNGSLRLNFANGTIEIPYTLAEQVAHDIDDFSIEDYNNYYK